MARNEHLVVIMLESVKIGQEFIDWPLHITLAPWFPCDNGNKLSELLGKVASRHAAFEVQVGGVEDFGNKTPVPVNVIIENPQLMKLHWEIFNTLDANGFIIHQKEHVGDGYRAHITHQKHGRKQEGQMVAIESFSLVKQVRLKKTGTMVKSLVKTYELGA